MVKVERGRLKIGVRRRLSREGRTRAYLDVECLFDITIPYFLSVRPILHLPEVYLVIINSNIPSRMSFFIATSPNL